MGDRKQAAKQHPSPGREQRTLWAVLCWAGVNGHPLSPPGSGQSPAQQGVGGAVCDGEGHLPCGGGSPVHPPCSAPPSTGRLCPWLGPLEEEVFGPPVSSPAGFWQEQPGMSLPPVSGLLRATPTLPPGPPCPFPSPFLLRTYPGSWGVQGQEDSPGACPCLSWVSWLHLLRWKLELCRLGSRRVLREGEVDRRPLPDHGPRLRQQGDLLLLATAQLARCTLLLSTCTGPACSTRPERGVPVGYLST